jgi:GDP-L-fucose synthase
MKRVFVAGHNGMVGSAIVRRLVRAGDVKVITACRDEVDLSNQSCVSRWFEKNKFDEIYLAAAKVGGIHANNQFPGDFIYQNLIIEANVIHSAFLSGVSKLLFLGSSCIYPKHAKQPIKESDLLTGKLEQTNEPYAIAKIAGIKLCESYNRQYGVDYRCLMPTNLYGPFDNFHDRNGHVIPSLMRRLHYAKINQQKNVRVWGTGRPKREFLFVDDAADASFHIMNVEKDEFSLVTRPMQSHINVGTGSDCSIRNLVLLMSEVIGFSGCVQWDASMPDGAPRKLLDVSLAKRLGWQSSTSLRDGLRATYEWFLKNVDNIRQD